ncbi:MAG TPA: hypothetical protein VFZ65_04505 [Planctomycetota bacterium]|nr:hypothetical protein [Planctomycetota bacterium]
MKCLPFPRLLLLATCLVPVSNALAQRARFESTGGPLAVSTKARGLESIDGVLWASGPRYKASFTAAGVTFVPALGRRSPRTRSLAIQLESCGRTDEVRTAGAASPEPLDFEVRYHRPGVTERYAVLAEGIEQSFVFDERPAGHGDLVLHLRLTTDLPLAACSPQALRFEDAQLGGVCVRDLAAIDAAGNRCPGTLQAAQDPGPEGAFRVELVIPAAFVDTAMLPLVVDPMFGTTLQPGPGPDDEYQDVAYEPTQDMYLVVWDRSASILAIDLVGQRVSGSGNLVGGLITLRSGVVGLSPNRVAAVDARDTFVAVWYEVGVQTDVWAAAVHAGTGTTSGPLLLTGGSTNDENPDVGVASDADDAAIVVWDNYPQAVVRGMRVTVAPGGALTTGTVVDLCPIGAGRGPRLSRRGGSRLLATWYQPGTPRIDGAVIDQNLQVLTSFPIVPAAPDLRGHSTDGDGVDWIVAYERGGGYPNSDIYGRCVHYDAATNQATVGPAVPIANQPTVTETEVSVAWLGSAAAIGYVSVNDWNGPAWTTSTVVKVVDGFTCAACQPAAIAVTRPAMWGHSSPRLVARPGGNGTAPEALFTYMELPPGTLSLVYAQRFRSDDGLEWDRGGACGGGTAWHGCAVPGNSGYSLRLEGAPPLAPTFLFVGTTLANVACGACTIVPDPASGAASFVGLTSGTGASAVALPIPAQSSLVGFSFFEQWLTWAPGSSCFDLAVSNALEIQLQ